MNRGPGLEMVQVYDPQGQSIKAHSKAISAYGKKKQWQQAIGVLESMQDAYLVPNVITYNCAISALKRAGQWQQALSLLAGMLPPTAADVVSFGAAIGACAECEQWQRALSLLQLMRPANLCPTVITYSSAISACGNSGEWQHALALLSEMLQANVAPDVITYSAVVTACEKGAQWQQSLSLLMGMENAILAPSVITYNAAMSACEKSAQWQQALGLLRLMQRDNLTPDLITYSAAMSACEKGWQWKRALTFMEVMQKGKQEPDVIVYSVAISACAKGAQWKHALGLLAAMRSAGIGPKVHAYSAAITACQKAEQWQEALCLLAWMQGSEVAPNVVAYSAAISACEKGGQWQQSLYLLAEMQQAGLTPDVIAYSATMSACEKCGQWQTALHLFSLMAESKVDPNTITFSAAISACEKGGKWDRALHLFTLMAQRHVESNTITFGAAISACEKGGEWKHALQLISMMVQSKVESSTITFNAAISACEKGEQWTRALDLLNQMRLDYLQPDIITFHAAILACSKAQKWQRTLQLLHEVQEATMSAPPIMYSYAMMDMEQCGPVAQEVALLQSFGRQCREFGLTIIDTAVAAASRLVGEGHAAEAKNLLLGAVASGSGSPAAQVLLQACGHHAVLQGAVTRAYQQLSKANPYWKELSLLQHVLDHAHPGNPMAVCDAMDDFADSRWQQQQQWSKVAGDLKSEVLCSSVRGAALGIRLLEIGTYCGYTALRIAATFPSLTITTLEVDPIHVTIARNMVALSGLAQSLDVWTGHSKYVLPRLAQRRTNAQQLQYGALYMDRWGSEYHDDFILLDSLRLLESSAVIIADQVLWTGAGLFLWDVANKANCSTRLVPVSVKDEAIEEDFLTVSACCSGDKNFARLGQGSTSLELDYAKRPTFRLSRLHAESEFFRRKWVENHGASGSERISFARNMQQQMLAELANLGYDTSEGTLPDAS